MSTTPFFPANNGPAGASKRAEILFHEALDLSPGEREAFLHEACSPDASLRAEVDGYLHHYEQAGSFLKEDSSVSPELAAEFARLKPEEVGERIGPYKLLEQIGEGGFGTVWVAEQEKPIRRRVALKIIKLGMDTKEVIARFEQERQALALMDHPNIAKVLDAGATQYGRPFFVMELVRGLKITDYCDDKQLSTAQRIELFVTVCQAVQHAHQKGIIHRDLKPSNILVTVNDGRAVPKVIDFGVAKATQGRLVEQTVYTQFQQMIGTPLYMSPEQAELTSLDIDTRSDIYSLGVLLYELLTGHTPIDQNTLARLGMDEIRRIIREVDPPRPSLRMKTLDGPEMTTAAKRRNIEPAKLSGALRGDLDWIVMKCIEKDRSRRYDTANSLARDLERHLRNEVVNARPPTAGYLLGKLIRRHKLTFAAAAAIAASLVLGIVASLWQAKRARDEGARARQAASQAKAAEERVTAALDELRTTAPAFAEQARSLASRERFDEAIEKLDYAIKLHPDVAEYLVAKGDLLQCQFKLAAAAAIYREALRVHPGLARAETSAKLCDELLAAEPGEQGKLTRESLAKLHLAMQQQQRPAAELISVARLLGEKKKLLVDYWLARLKDLPVSAEKPLKDRLTVREDGRLALDLSDTKLIDLSPLTGAPLAVLNVSGSKELIDLSPLRGLDLIELNISMTSVVDLSPLREMHMLKKLNVANSKVTELSALNGLRLDDLDLEGTRTFDVSVLRGMKLKKLSLRDTRVGDLSPLAGMPLTYFDASSIPAIDYSPLAGAPLEKCNLQYSPVRDLSFLQDSPVKALVLNNCNEARGFAVLAGLKSLDLLVLPQSFRSLPEEDLAAIGALRAHPTLKNIQTEYRSGDWLINTTQSKDIFWQDWDREQAIVAPLRKSGIKFTLNRLPTGTYRLEIKDQPLSDLSFLKGTPIEELILMGTNVTDLRPLEGLALTQLDIRVTPVIDLSSLRAPVLSASLRKLEIWRIRATDFSPLAACTNLEYLDAASTALADLEVVRGHKLRTANFSGSRITDISALAGMPLERLVFNGTGVTDLSPLLHCPTLTELVLPVDARDVNALRDLPSLAKVSFEQQDGPLPRQTAEEFWKENGPNSWISRLRDSRIRIRYLKRLDDGTWEVNLEGSAFSDLTILSGAPISHLNLNNSAVADLTPLRGMALKGLHFRGTKVTDLSSLKGMPLTWLNLAQTKVTDISVLREMPLISLRMHGCTEIADLSPLASCKALKNVTLPSNAKNIEFLRTFPELEGISYRDDGVYGPDKTSAEFWTEYDAPWIARLRESGIKIRYLGRLDDGTWDVNFEFEGSAITDLTILSGAPISRLWLGGTAVSDLAPLHGMPLTHLSIGGTKVTDLTPLKGMPLDLLFVGATNVADLSPLRGMPLTNLNLHKCPHVTDLSPLADCRALKWLTLPLNARNLEIVRTFPKLEGISFNENPNNAFRPDKTAAEFWQEYDAKKK